MKPYTPQPVDTSDVELSAELLQLAEQLAKNVHDVWAQSRISQGWTYGSQRDDVNLHHPGLVEYEDLSETEKAYDRDTALETLRLITKLGWKIERP